jgi:hypothetical protein
MPYLLTLCLQPFKNGGLQTSEAEAKLCEILHADRPSKDEKLLIQSLF